MAKYTKISDDIFEEIVNHPPPPRVSKKAIQYQIKVLEDQLKDLQEPKNQELIDLGRSYHPYYNEAGFIQSEIIRLENIKSEIDKM
jgi:hypothetical protein